MKSSTAGQVDLGFIGVGNKRGRVLIGIYGDPEPEVTAMAAGFNLAVFTPWQGFDR
jgi:hypothetical protein